MRSGGFPCRFDGCSEVFTVPGSAALDVLLAASAERTEHEVSAHDYHHVRLDEHPKRPPLAPKPVRSGR